MLTKEDRKMSLLCSHLCKETDRVESILSITNNKA